MGVRSPLVSESPWVSVLVGLTLLAAVPVFPVIDIATAEFTGPEYTIDGSCSGIVDEAVGNVDNHDRAYNYSELSEPGQRYVRYAVENGSYTVPADAPRAPEFSPYGDVIEEGCYAVNYEGGLHPILVSPPSERVDDVKRLTLYSLGAGTGLVGLALVGIGVSGLLRSLGSDG